MTIVIGSEHKRVKGRKRGYYFRLMAKIMRYQVVALVLMKCLIKAVPMTAMSQKRKAKKMTRKMTKMTTYQKRKCTKKKRQKRKRRNGSQRQRHEKFWTSLKEPSNRQ